MGQSLKETQIAKGDFVSKNERADKNMAILSAVETYTMVSMTFIH